MVALLLWFYIAGGHVIGGEVNVQLLEAAYDNLPVKEGSGSEPPVWLVG